MTVLALVSVMLLTGGWWWGSDTNSTPPSQPGTSVRVYTGQLGYTSTSTCHTAYFNIAAANDVKKNNGSYDNVYSYWFLQGPAVNGQTYTSAYVLGKDQAYDLYQCWLHATKASYSWGLTIFADAEWTKLQTNGTRTTWYTTFPKCDCVTTAHWQSNVNVISGFVAEAKALVGGLANFAGIYTSISFLNSRMPNSVWPSKYFDWFAGGGCQTPSIVEPYTLQTTTWYETEMVKWHTYNVNNKCLLGGQGVSMWQYFTSAQGPRDFDLTPQENDVTCATNYEGLKFCGGDIIPGWGDGSK